MYNYVFNFHLDPDPKLDISSLKKTQTKRIIKSQRVVLKPPQVLFLMIWAFATGPQISSILTSSQSHFNFKYNLKEGQRPV